MNIRKTITILKNGLKSKSIIVLIGLLPNTSFSELINSKREEDNSILCCYNLILNKLKLSHSVPTNRFKHKLLDNDYEVTSIIGHLSIRRKSQGQIHLKSTSENIDRWNNIIDWKKVKYGLIRGKHPDFLISVAPIVGVSGLETNFYKYLVVNLKTGEFKIKQSLSNDSRFIYFRLGELELYLFDYSKSFLTNRDYDNVSLRIDKFRIQQGSLKLIEFKEKVCDCTLKK